MDQNTRMDLSKKIMWISGIFCLVIAVLLLANFAQLKKSDPIESKTMEALTERLNSEPDNEQLREEIRQFDLLARKAYFTATWQVKTGAWLLLAGALVFAIAMKVHSDIRKKINPPLNRDDNPVAAGNTSGRWLLVTGIILIFMAFTAAFFSVDELSSYSPESKEIAVNTPVEDEIEVIQIVDADTTEAAIIPSEIEDTIETEIIPEETESTKTEVTQKETKKDKTEIVYYGENEFKKYQATFRGLYGHGIAYHKNIPTDWDGATGNNILWKVALSKSGYNTPVIWGDKIFLAGGDNQALMVSCFNKNNGQLLWEQEVTGIPGSPARMPQTTDDTGLSAPTMAVDGYHAYAIFANGDLIAFTLEGKTAWSRNLGVPENHYGHSSSLIVWKNKLVIQYDTGKGGRMLAVDVMSGKTIWDIKRNNQISWSSPILLPKDNRMQVITTSDPYIAGYDIANGDELWKVEALMGEVAPSAAYWNGIVFGTNEYARTVAVKPEAGSEIIWEDNYYLSEVSSPVAWNGLLFLATSYGDLICHNAENGEIMWEKHFNSGFYSSPMIAGEKLYIIDMEGIMHILKADDSGTVINEPALGEAAFASPVFDEGRIYLRSNTALYCIEEN